MATPKEIFSLESLLGEKLLTKVGVSKKTSDVMKGKELVLLYFSASWCPPCKAFSPILKSFYNSTTDKNIEVIYVSSDGSVDEFNGYYKTMPWAAIPTEQGSSAIKTKLAQTFGIMGIPTLVVVDAKTGEFVTNGAREDVSKTNGNAAQAKEVVNNWKTAERKPLSEAGGGGGNPIMKLISFLARKPMYLIGIFYFYKLLMKKVKSISADNEEL